MTRTEKPARPRDGSESRDIRRLARKILDRMGDGTYTEDIDEMREDADMLCTMILRSRKRRAR